VLVKGQGGIFWGRTTAMKWRYRIAQGFYEADFVKTALLKSIF
jgi:hypothetical protein